RHRHRHHRDRRRSGRHLQSVPTLHRARLRHHHVRGRGAGRHGQHPRRLLGRHDHRPRATALDLGAADATAERRDLRRLPADRDGAPASPVRPRHGARLMRSRRNLVTSLVAIAAIAAVWIGLSLVVTNSYYQLMLTLVPIWAVLGLSWNLLSGYTGLVSFGHAAFF